MRRAWSVAKLVVGLGAVLAQAALAFLVAERAHGRILGVVALVLGCVVAPVVVAKLLTGPLRRLDPEATFWRNLPGVAAILAILEIGGLGLLLPRAAGEALRAVPRTHPGAGRIAGRIAGTVGEWLAPGASPKPKGRPRPRSMAPARTDAGAARPATRRDAAVPATDASDDGRRDAAPAPEADAAPAAPPPAESVGSVDVCETVRSILPIDLGQEPTDEIVVGCDGTVHVLWPRPDGSVQERTRFSPPAPAGLVRVLADPRVADLDEDGRMDAILCAYWRAEGGGTRGGDSWWARGTADGQFEAPARLVGGFCAGIDVGDVDADGETEIVLAHRGNPWMEEQPNGELRWFERAAARRWRPAGRTPLHRDPMGLFLADANGDGTLDAVAQHAWDLDDVTVCLGGPQGLAAIDAGVRAPAAPDRTVAPARLDDDDRPDRVSVHGGSIEIRRTSGEPLRPLTRSLDYREYP